MVVLFLGGGYTRFPIAEIRFSCFHITRVCYGRTAEPGFVGVPRYIQPGINIGYRYYV